MVRRGEHPRWRECNSAFNPLEVGPPLTAQGHEAAAAKLCAVNVAAVYVSPLRRARQTAEAIACATPRIVLPQLAEIDFGEWEGLTYDAAATRTPALYGRWRTAPHDVTVGQLEERFAQACQRADQLLGEPAAVRYFLNAVDEWTRPELIKNLPPQGE